jgi:hypothetical protein
MSFYLVTYTSTGTDTDADADADAGAGAGAETTAHTLHSQDWWLFASNFHNSPPVEVLRLRRVDKTP